jgi:hypothetical protein
MSDTLRTTYLKTLPRNGIPLYMTIILYGTVAFYVLTVAYAWVFLHTWYNIITKLAGITAIAAFAAVWFKTRSDILQGHFDRLDKARKEAGRLIPTVYQRVTRDRTAKSYPTSEIIDNLETYRIQDIFAHLQVDCEAARMDTSQLAKAALTGYLQNLSRSEGTNPVQRERIMNTLRSLGAIEDASS